MIKKINFIIPAIFLLLFMIFFKCSNNQIKKSENITFAVISNTHAESPYARLDKRTLLALKQIREENPVFLMHLGGMICAGSEWSGINKDDVERQYNEFYSSMPGHFPIFYTVKSDSELLNNSPDYYYKHTNRPDYYSFNYGSLHFLVLDSTGSHISKEQKEWMINDLIRYKNSAAIFVFINKPLFKSEKFKSQCIINFKDKEILHEFFVKHQVKAVISGACPEYFKSDIDGISYINAGCGGFTKEEILKGYSQYYTIEYNNNMLIIHPQYITSRNK